MATVRDLRAVFDDKTKDGVPNPPGHFHPLDLHRFNDDRYMQRILQHNDYDLKLSFDMLWSILLWRKEVGANDINEGNIRLDYVKEGIFFPHGRDVDGSLLLIIKSKMHSKGQKDFEDIKRILIYWLDRLEREENGKKITLFFDMEGCGLGNMDMELIKYLINLFKLYYPYFLNYIIIYQMPWVLNAAFKVVKTLLPAKAVERMKFTNKDSLKDVVTPEQALVCWGGRDNYTFEFIPENRGSSEHTPKKVTFAEQGDSQHSPGEMLQLSTTDMITFKNENDEISGEFSITNMDESAISFKIRTTSPDKFRVRPSSGILASGESQKVLIVVQQGFQLRTLIKDRFLVLAVQIPKMDLSMKELAELWQNSSKSKIDEYRLKCHFPEKDISKNGNMLDGNSYEKPDSVTNALDNMQQSYEMLHRDMRKLKTLQLLTLLLTAVAVILGYLLYKNSSDGYCEHI